MMPHIVVALCVFILSVGVYAADDHISDINIYFEETHRPYNFNTDGEIDGINGLTVKHACEKEGVTCNFIAMPWTRAMATVLKDPKGAIMSAARNAAREPFFRWVGPIMSGQAMYFRLKSRTDIVINTPLDALQYSIGVQRNDIYESVLQARGFVVGENLLNTRSKDDATRLFLLGRLDLLIASDFTVKSLIESQGASLDEIEAIAYLDTPEIKGNYLAMNPQVPEVIAKALDEEIAEYRRTAEFFELVNRFRPQNLVFPKR